jgi:hypothetical protein
MQLDGKTYKVNFDGWKIIDQKIGVSRATLTGRVDRTEARAFARTFELVCQVKATSTDPTEGTLATLRASYLKTDVSTNRLLFVDPEGVIYDPATGVDTPTHFYDCGVYFEQMDSPKNLSPMITGPEATLYVPILLRVAKVSFNA